jgi:hypothetical protein
MRKKTGLIIMGFSFACLIAGLIYPFMTLKIEVEMQGGGGILDWVSGGSLSSQINKNVTYNIPQAMNMLFEKHQFFVGILIGLFAFVVPIVKTGLTLWYLFSPSDKMYNVIHSMGKFAMADVFCVGVFIAFLYTRFNDAVSANIETGYYWFAMYVILNIVGLTLTRKPGEK